KGGSISQLQAGPDFLLFSKSTLTAPPELFRVSLDGSSTKQLTNENSPWLSRTAMPQTESLTVTGAAGTSIQYWLLKPPNFDPSRKYPAVFLIHGGPQGDWGDSWSSRWNPALWAAQGWIVAAPNPRGSTGFGQRFVDEISQDWCGKVMVDLNAVFENDQQFYRPAQDCSKRYGYAVSINRILQLDAETYREAEVDKIVPNGESNVVGVHTFNVAGDMTVIDCLVRRKKLWTDPWRSPLHVDRVGYHGSTETAGRLSGVAPRRSHGSRPSVYPQGA